MPAIPAIPGQRSATTSEQENLPIIVLEPIRPGYEPDHCIHGRVRCSARGCDTWCWLGHRSIEVVRNREAIPVCAPCANRHAKGWREIGNAGDHQREDGPHE